MNSGEPFEKVFNEAETEGWLHFNNMFQREAEYSLHDALFTSYLQELNGHPQTQLTPIQYQNLCTFENFKNYLSGYHESHTKITDQLNAVQKIDSVLKFLYDRPPFSRITELRLIAEKLVSTYCLMSYYDLMRCVNQLENDKMIRREGDDKHEVSITWDGQFFYETGGYESDTKDEANARRAPVQMARMQVLIVILTIVLSITASATVVFEFLNYFHPNN